MLQTVLHLHFDEKENMFNDQELLKSVMSLPYCLYFNV